MLYKRPTDLALREDVPVVCNLLLADIMDEGVCTTETSERPCPRAKASSKLKCRIMTELGGKARQGKALSCPDMLLASCQCAAAGLLASGLIPAVRHSLLHLLTADARVLPAAATVLMQVRALAACCAVTSCLVGGLLLGL